MLRVDIVATLATTNTSLQVKLVNDKLVYSSELVTRLATSKDVVTFGLINPYTGDVNKVQYRVITHKGVHKLKMEPFHCQQDDDDFVHVEAMGDIKAKYPAHSEQIQKLESLINSGESIVEDAKKGNWRQVSEAIDSGVNLECKDALGDTVLLYALREGKLELVKKLLAHGADVSSCGSGKYTVFHSAISRRNASCSFELVTLLRQHISNRFGDAKCNALINARNASGETPIYRAVEANHKALAKLLIGFNANTELADDNGLTPLHYATKHCPTMIVTLLNNGANPLTFDNQGRSPLHQAAANGDFKLMETFLEKVKHIYADEVAKGYLERKSKDGTTLACITARCALPYDQDGIEVLKTLKKVNVDLNHSDNQKQTPLMHACRKGNYHLTNWLVEQQVALDSKDARGMTAVMIAAEQGKIEIVKLLINAGANVGIKTQPLFGKTLIDFVPDSKKDEIKQVIEQRKAAQSELGKSSS
ncbi:MAG: ankyrin repeat domain-containing protein [Parashewanella sp.]